MWPWVAALALATSACDADRCHPSGDTVENEENAIKWAAER